MNPGKKCSHQSQQIWKATRTVWKWGIYHDLSHLVWYLMAMCWWKNDDHEDLDRFPSWQTQMVLAIPSRHPVQGGKTMAGLAASVASFAHKQMVWWCLVLSLNGHPLCFTMCPCWTYGELIQKAEFVVVRLRFLHRSVDTTRSSSNLIPTRIFHTEDSCDEMYEIWSSNWSQKIVAV